MTPCATSKPSIALLLLAALVIVGPAGAQSSLCGEWEVVATPVPETGDLGSSQFRDIVAVGPDDVWAVGEIHTGSPDWETHTLAMHWNGTEWTTVSTPNPSSSINSLECVAAISGDDVWAAGVKEVFTPFRELRALILHWDGAVWEEVLDPALDAWGTVIWTIEVVTADDIWFGSDGVTTFHWDGSDFEARYVPSFDTGNCSGTYGCGHSVVDIAAVGPDDVWAVGGASDGDYSFVSQIWHWDGVEWTHTPGPSIPYFQRLNGVIALATDDVWAVGDLEPADPGDNGMLIIHWDGTGWSRVEAPLFTQPSGDLQDVFALAPDDIWAAGIYTEMELPAPGLPLTMHYDGTDWRQVVPDPNGPEGAWLRGVTAAGSCDLWAVGSSMDAPFVQRLTPGWPAEIEVTPASLEFTVAPGGQATHQLSVGNQADPAQGATLDWSISEVIPPAASEPTWIDSDTPGGPTFAWRDIRSVGTSITLYDDWQVEAQLPFTFWFYGQPQNSILIGSNGYITFADYGYEGFNYPIPDSRPPNDVVAVFWDNLNPQHPVTPGSVHYYYDPVEEEFIVQYTDVPQNTGGLPYTFEVILRLNGDILFQYLSMEGVLTSATIGIENGDGTQGLEVTYNAPYVHDELAILFPLGDPDWISESSTGGSVPPQSGTTIDVVADATGLAPGTYTASLLVWSNDPDEARTTIPVTLHVSDVVGIDEQTSTALELAPIRPSPFRTSAEIAFSLDRPARTRLDVFDATGRRVSTLVDAELTAGRHGFTWDGGDDGGRPLTAGMYFVRLKSGDRTVGQRVVLLR